MNFKFTLLCIVFFTYNLRDGSIDARRVARGYTANCKKSDFPPHPQTYCCGLDQADDNLERSGNAAINQFPWIALIEDAKKEVTCTGTLISSRYVLTAAQCLFREPTHVRLGDFNKTNTGPDCISTGGVTYCNEGAVSISIEEYIPHPMFESPNFHGNDIAILKLAKAVPYTTFMRPICMPTYDITLSPPKDLHLINAGWGSKPTNEFEEDVLKHYVQLPHKSLPECQMAYKMNLSEMDNHYITENQICAGGEDGLDSCRGDGGGPLMHAEEGQYSLHGIVSYGPVPCGRIGVPSVYTKVFAYLPWIQSVISSRHERF
ncbi:phenoloxidase-activating enzyme-like [Aricia agestis]|uniref:phenoloxidase-activating enzyme-like n=1 Tax=Aricia agestis TaxID=91739 RepID=UPI001C2019C0|nr:phenoloxidase-activating enzyme-like [Aricia agestis]